MENSENKNEVFIEDVFNADIERVYQAWTDPEKLMKWYAPIGCSIRFTTIEIKPGGKFHSCISNPQYGDCWCIGEYKELVPNMKIVFTLINADDTGKAIDPVDIGMDPAWPGETLVTITLAEEGGQTRLQLRQTVSQEVAQRTGAYPSWLQMLKRMSVLLEKEVSC